MASIYGYPGGINPLFRSIAAPGFANPPALVPFGIAPMQLPAAQPNPMGFFDQLDQAINGALQVGGPVTGVPMTYGSSLSNTSMGSLEQLVNNPVYQEYSVSNLLSGLNWQAIYQILATPPQQTTESSAQPATGVEATQNSSPRPGIQATQQTVPIKIAPGAEKAIGDVDSFIQASAKRHGLPPNLVQAVIAQESGGNPKAQSPAGAKGLMQLMPRTFGGLRDELVKTFGETDRVDNPFDPEVNIEAGCIYLGQMKAKFGSDELALAAYNAGPGAVQKQGGIPRNKETQNYVPSVLAKAEALKSEQA